MIWMENYDEHYAFGFLMLVSVQLVFSRSARDDGYIRVRRRLKCVLVCVGGIW